MDTLILEDFRCFADRHEVPIRPLTLLVGENSTGKTSFLAAVRAAYDLRLGQSPDFNEEPFHLGSYNQVANQRGGTGRAKRFVIGQQFQAESRPRRLRGVPRKTSSGKAIEARVTARFTSIEAQPTLSCLSISSGEHDLRLENLASEHPVMSFLTGKKVVFRLEAGRRTALWRNRLVRDDWAFLRIARYEAQDNESMTEADKKGLDALIDSVQFLTDPRPYAFAPIRMSPQRTYDPGQEIRDPEGSHIPMMLNRLLDNGGLPEFKDRLNIFGVSSGLYSDLFIRNLGRKGDPFQILIKPLRGGLRRNLVDVGYGVSQAIPIIADAAATEIGTTLLIQQPEVHLHPRAQAAMGSFFAQLAASERNRLVVETHSDYLVDRVRMEVRDERIKASDVVVLYFEQIKHGVDIHPITIDAMGNLENAPASYGGFFLEEQRRFFMID